MDEQTPVMNSTQTGFTDEFLNHAYTPRNVGSLSNPDGFGAPTGACGDIIEIGLLVRDGIIEKAVFMTDGCVHTVACASVATTLIEGRDVKDALKIEATQIEETLGGLPKEHQHCARLAVTTVRLAVKDYFKNDRTPWKKLYRTNGSSM